MSKSSTRLGRPGSAGSKSPVLKKELQGNRSCMLRIGERLMRAGSEGNLVQRPIPAQSQSHVPTLEDKPTEFTGNKSSKDPGNSLSRVSSSSAAAAAVDSTTEHLLQKKQLTSSTLLCNPDVSSYGTAPRSPSTLPRSYATSSAASSRDGQLDSLMLHHAEAERKREVFLDHLRQKYPHHAAIIMGHQDHMREQVRSLRPSESPLCVGVLGLVEQQDPLVSETMSEGEVLPPTVPFLRGCKARASLPVGRSSGQPRERPLGVLYLQYGEETKQIRMPDEISSRETLQALFVTAFPHQLTMKMLQSPSMAIYIKDTSRNVYYDLEDVRNITSHSCLKVYHKDPAQVFIRHARPASTEGRISKEMLYGSHSPVHTLSSSNCSTLHGLQGSMSPPMVRSMPSSPSRKAYGGGSVRGGGPGLVDPGSATLPWERLPGVGRSSTVCTSSSVILERRDVKPDEDAGSSKSMALVVRGEGGPHYPDSYCSSLQDGGGGRSSFASSQCSAPPSLAVSLVDAGVAGIPGGLQQYRASIKPLMGYRESMDHSTCSLHRQKSRKYGESQFPPLGTKTSPASPHRVSDVRMIDGQITGGVGLMSPERMSPIRRSLRRDSNGGTVEIINRSRGGGSSSSASSVFVDSPQEQPERLFQGHVTASNDQSERMKAMEEQLASLAGLVHHALSMGSDVPGVEDTVSENAGRKLLNNRPVSSEPQNSATLIDGFSPAPLALQASDSRLQHRLVLAKKSVCELRLQLSQLRDLQLSNQETVSSMLRMAGQELMLLMCDRLAQSEEAAYRRRAEMEEERIHYLAKEDRILKQISEVEDYVDRLQRSSASSPGQLSVTLRDVEEGAVGLRRVGEALAALKGEFPELQVKMRSLLRMEVEAVRFLKEEPHKMDSMLKRVKALTDGLSSLRRCVSESASPSRSAQVEPLKVLETDQGPMRTPSPKSPPKPPLRSSVRSPLPTPALSGSQAEVSQVGSASPVLAQRMMSTAATVTHHHQHHHPSPPLKPTHGQDSPTVAKVSPRSREGSPALQRRLGPPQSNGTSTQGSHTDQTTVTHTQTHTETTEGSLSGQTSSTNQSSGSQAKQTVSSDSCRPPSSNASTDVHRGLQEAQASLMESIPNLNVSDTRECPSESASGQNTPLDLTVQASVEQQQPDTQLSDEIISSQLQPSNTAPAASSQPPAATATPPPSAASSAERGSRPPVEKPRRSSVDKEMMKQSADRAGRSPPPPPRRVHAVNAGLTTGRSGEVTFTTRKDMAGAQDEGEKEKPEKDRPVVPQPKPPRQLPEVKPKPQMCVPAPLALVSTCSTPATASAHRGEEEEEEEEDSKFMKEVQVTTELSNKNDLSGGNKQWKGQLRTSSTLRVANQKPSDSATCEHQSAPRSGNTDVSTHKLITAAGLEGLSKEVEVPPPAASRDGVPRNGELPPLNQKKVEKMEALRVPTSPKENDLIVNTDEQNNREFVGNVRSPTTAENKVKFTTVVTLKKGKTQGTDLTCPDQTSGKAVKEVPAEKRSNLTVIVTLQKENGSTDSSPTVQQDKSLSSDQEGLASPLVQKPSPPSPGLTHSYSSSSRQQSQDAALQAFRNQSLFTEEGGSLSPDTLEDEGPPPPPPVGKISLRISKTRVRSQSKQEDLAKMNGSDPQTVSGDSTGESAYLVHENQGFEDGDDFDKKPIIVIFNEPMDTLSAYKRLSTIFECEEDLDGILSPESIVAEEQTQQEEDKQDVRKLCISEINTRRDVTGNGQNHLHQRPSAGSDSVHGNQNQGKADLLRKTETKRKFKFKFPKNKLAAISQAIRTGSRTGKKTLEVVVLEEEEEMASDSKPVKENEKQTKESKMSHTNSTKYFSLGEGNGCDRDLKVSSHRHSKPHSRVEKLCQSTSNSIDSLEESIKQLGISVDSITAPSSPSSSLSSPPQSPNSVSSERAHLKRQVQREREKSPSKRPAPQILKGPTPPQSKRVKPQPPHDRGKTSSKRQTSSSSSSSSALRPHSKSRHSSGSSGSPEKTPKGQQQAAPKQPSQADSRRSRASGDSKCCVVALRASKIPALFHSSGKHPSASVSTPHCSDTSSSSSSSSGKHSLLSSPSNVSKCPSLRASPSSAQRSRQQASLCPLSSSSSVSLSDSPPRSPSPPPSSFPSSPPPPHKSFIPSLNLSRLLPSSSHALFPSHANASSAHRGLRSGSKHQHHLVLASTSTSSTASTSQHTYHSSSSSPSSSTSSSLSPTSSSSSPPSPSSSLLPTTVSHGARSVRMSASNPSSPCHARKRTGSQAGPLVRTVATASRDTA